MRYDLSVEQLIGLVRQRPNGRSTCKYLSQAYSLAFSGHSQPQWNTLSSVIEELNIKNIPSPQEMLDLAFSSYNVDAVKWLVSHPTRPPDLDELSKKISSTLSGVEVVSTTFIVDLLEQFPGIIDGKRVVNSKCLSSVMLDALAYSHQNSDFEKICLHLSKVGPTSHDNALSSWLDFFSRSCSTPWLASQLLDIVEKNERVRKVIDDCLPMDLFGFTLPGGGPFTGYHLPTVKARTLPQLLAWSASSAMSVGMEYPCAQKIWEDPEGIKSWLPMAAHEPAQLARLIAKYPELREAINNFHDEEGKNSIHVISHVRLNNSMKRFRLLERQLIKSCPDLYTAPSSYPLSVPRLLSQHFPSWSADWKRSLLSTTASRTKPARDPSPQNFKM